MMIINHTLKIKEEYANAIITGDKTFEIRYNDRGYQKGDKVQFKYHHLGILLHHVINERIYEITYLLHGWGLKEDWCVFGIKEVLEE